MSVSRVNLLARLIVDGVQRRRCLSSSFGPTSTARSDTFPFQLFSRQSLRFYDVFQSLVRSSISYCNVLAVAEDRFFPSQYLVDESKGKSKKGVDGWLGEKNESFLQKSARVAEFARRQTVVDWIVDVYPCLSFLLYSSGGAVTQIQL